jgi:flagella basal body P-ring formation protein FlgA
MIIRIALLAVAAAGLASAARAAEIRLRSDCLAAGALVTLGDVAEIFASDAAEEQGLSQLELVPAPAPGTKRYLRAREIQDMLHDRGVNLAQHRISGASLVAVGVDAVRPVAHVEAPSSRPGSDMNNMRRRVVQAIIMHLQSEAGADRPWRVELDAPEASLHQLAGTSGRIQVAGGSGDRLGRQQFELQIDTGGAVARIPVEARVSLPDAVVVASRSLPRGAIVQAGDLRLEPQKAIAGQSKRQPYYQIEEVIGKETARAIAPGQVLDNGYVRAPVLVRRGDVVTVFARAGGIRIRTEARAREDGSQGDLIAVESLANREQYFARVTAIQQVEVFAQPIAAEQPAAQANR